MKVTLEDLIKVLTVDYFQSVHIKVFDKDLFTDGTLLNAINYEILKKSFLNYFKIFVNPDNQNEIYVSVLLEDSASFEVNNFDNWFLKEVKNEKLSNN